MRWFAPFLCLAIFHSPDGGELRVETQQIAVVRGADKVQEHVAPGIKSIIYVGPQKMGVVETPEEVEKIINDCLGDTR